MLEKYLLDNHWTPEHIAEMDPVMAKARQRVYMFVEEIESMKKEEAWQMK